MDRLEFVAGTSQEILDLSPSDVLACSCCDDVLRLEALGEAASSDGVMASGQVRFSLPAALGLYISDRLPASLVSCPGLFVDIVFSEQSLDLIGEAIDFEVRLGEVSDSSVICRRIGLTTAFLVATPSYVQRRGMPSHLHEIPDHDCIYYSHGSEGRSLVFFWMAPTSKGLRSNRG